jgi:DNA (cytosine-5)-methyltransferase 1
MGYHLAGFEVVGVDIAPQKRYPFQFIQADALEYLAAHGHEFDAIHASPPCQAYSVMKNPNPEYCKPHPELIEPVRDLLISTGKPYIIENVVGAPLIKPIMLCGSQFGLKVYRHRLFEVNYPAIGLPHYPHRDKTPKGGTRGNNISPKGFICMTGDFSNVPYARFASKIDWMIRDEMAEAIPPAFTQFLGGQLMLHLGYAPKDLGSNQLMLI